MLNSYTLRFSDPTNTGTIEVLGTTVGPGKNNYSTSLDLVGPGYTNYGLDTAQNFLKLLENFSGPNPPINAIKGQLWYDTSNPNRKVLRVNNGEITSNRWPAASGIYQQSSDPSVSYSSGVTIGDIWVDTASNQLKIRSSDGWTTVGPNIETGTNKSGPETVVLQSNTGSSFPVILNWANGKVVEIISYNEFTPRTVIDGFNVVKPGTNLTSRIPARYNGIAESASSLYIGSGQSIKAGDVLKNKSPLVTQVHTGTLMIESSGGLNIRKDGTSRPIKIYSTGSEAFVSYTNTASSSMKVGIKDDVFDKSFIKFTSGGPIGINNLNPVQTLDVTGTGKFTGALSITTSSNSALSVTGGATFGRAISVNTLTVLTTASLFGLVTLGSVGGSGTILEPAQNDSYELGTPTKAFRRIYVSEIASTGTYVFINGTVNSASTLETARTFRITGQFATTSSVSFNGSGNVNLITTATSRLISGQTTATSTTATQTILVLDTSTGATTGLQQISKAAFLSDVYSQVLAPGMIIPYGKPYSPSTSPPSGFLWCDGSTIATVVEPNLFAVIGYTYGGGGASFALPNMLTITTTTNAPPVTIAYIIKT